MRTTGTDERGISLLLTMLLVLLLMVAVTGATMRTTAERRGAMDVAAQVDAFAIAQSGIDRYLEGHTTVPAALPDSAVYTVPGGRAVVTMYRFRAAAADTLLIVASRGENTSLDRYSADASVAVRTVAQMVRFSTGSFNPPAGFVSLTPMQKNGNSGSLSGVDACNTAPAPKPSIPGVAVPSISAVNLLPAYSGFTGPINGNPDNTPVAIGTPGPTGTAKDAVDIDWAGIVAKTSLTPTYFLKTTSPTSGSWPSSAQMNGSNWPIVMVEGDATLPDDGQGILIVTGDLRINGSDTWKGIILVGGTFTSNGNNNIQGSLITGLNVKLGMTVDDQTVGNGNKLIQYNSCHIANAMAQFGGWQRVRNGWLDNWPSY